MGAGADILQELDHIIDIFVETEAPRFHRHVAGILPVGDIDVMVLQQRRYRAAQQGCEMPRHRRHHQHLGLGGLDVILHEMQQVAERQVEYDLLAHLDLGIAGLDTVNAIGGALVGHTRALEHVHQGEHAARHRPVGDRTDMVAHRQRHLRPEAGRGQHVFHGLVTVVKHSHITKTTLFNLGETTRFFP